MIRINLLGTPKPKKGKRAVVNVPGIGEGEGPSVLVLVLILVLLTVVGNGVWYWKLKREAETIQTGMQRANADYARLTQIKARYQERERQRELFKKRIDVIDQLRSTQSGPVNLLSMLSDTVNRTDELWLSTMNDDGNAISLKGVALSVHAVADLMRHLESTGYFKAVDIKSSYQDEAVRDMQAFVFELNCQKQPAQAPATQPAAPQPPQAKKS